MESVLGIAVILFLTILAPIFIVLHFVTKWKQSREYSRDDEQMLEDLWALSERLADRVETLEKILDDDLPDRRRRYESTNLEH